MTKTYPSKEDRKVKQVISLDGALIALCEDGSVWGWMKKDKFWIQFPEIPVASEGYEPPMIKPNPPK